jgi:hypothetical protein
MVLLHFLWLSQNTRTWEIYKGKLTLAMVLELGSPRAWMDPSPAWLVSFIVEGQRGHVMREEGRQSLGN